jgi:hypothetical protein
MHMQVIIERMDRLKPGVHLTLKVASVMGQWVDLDILHRFYPIKKSTDELQRHLLELERGNFLKPADTEGVWEFNMVERDIVYEVSGLAGAAGGGAVERAWWGVTPIACAHGSVGRRGGPGQAGDPPVTSFVVRGQR